MLLYVHANVHSTAPAVTHIVCSHVAVTDAMYMRGHQRRPNGGKQHLGVSSQLTGLRRSYRGASQVGDRIEHLSSHPQLDEREAGAMTYVSTVISRKVCPCATTTARPRSKQWPLPVPSC